MGGKRKIIFIALVVFFGFINLIFHEWSNWNLGLYLGELYGIDFNSGPIKFPNYIVLNSFYGGPRFGELKILQVLLIMGLSGYYTTKLLVDKLIAKKYKKLTFAVTCMLWLVKIPVPVYLSNLPATFDSLLAW